MHLDDDAFIDVEVGRLGTEMFLTSHDRCIIAHEDTVALTRSIHPPHTNTKVAGAKNFVRVKGVVVGCNESIMRRIVSHTRNIWALGGL